MKNTIILLMLLAATTAQAQLAEFATKGFEDSRWIIRHITAEDGELVQTILPVNDDGDYEIYGDHVDWGINEAGVYIITMQRDKKETNLWISIPDEGLPTKDSYNMRRRNHYLD